MARYYDALVPKPVNLYVGAPAELDMEYMKQQQKQQQEEEAKLQSIFEPFRNAKALSQVDVYGEQRAVEDRNKLREKEKYFNTAITDMANKISSGEGKPTDFLSSIRNMRRDVNEYFAPTGEGGQFAANYETYNKMLEEKNKVENLDKAKHLANDFYLQNLAYSSGNTKNLSNVGFGKYIDSNKEVDDRLTGIGTEARAWANANQGYIDSGKITERTDNKILSTLLGANYNDVLKGDWSKMSGMLENSGTKADIENQYKMNIRLYGKEEANKIAQQRLLGLAEYAMNKFRSKDVDAHKSADSTWQFNARMAAKAAEKEEERNRLLQTTSSYDMARISAVQNSIKLDKEDFDPATGKFTGDALKKKGGMDDMGNLISDKDEYKFNWDTKQYELVKNPNAISKFIEWLPKAKKFYGDNRREDELYNIWSQEVQNQAALTYKEHTLSTDATKEWQQKLFDRAGILKSDAFTIVGENGTITVGSVDELAKELGGMSQEELRKRLTDNKTLKTADGARFLGVTMVDPKAKGIDPNVDSKGTHAIFTVAKGDKTYKVYATLDKELAAFGEAISNIVEDRQKALSNMQSVVSKPSLLEKDDATGISTYNRYFSMPTEHGVETYTILEARDNNGKVVSRAAVGKDGNKITLGKEDNDADIERSILFQKDIFPLKDTPLEQIEQQSIFNLAHNRKFVDANLTMTPKSKRYDDFDEQNPD